MRISHILSLFLAAGIYSCKEPTQYIQHNSTVADGYKGPVKRVTCTSMAFTDTSGIPFHDTIWPATVVVTDYGKDGWTTHEQVQSMPDDGFAALLIPLAPHSGDSITVLRTIHYSKEDSTPTKSISTGRWINDSTYREMWYSDEKASKSNSYGIKVFDRVNGKLLRYIFPQPLYNFGVDTTTTTYTYKGDTILGCTTFRSSNQRDSSIAIVVSRDAHGNATLIKVTSKDRQELYKYAYEYYK